MGNNKKIPKKNIIKIWIFSVLGVLLLCYVGVILFNLIKNPTDTFIVENDDLYLEERVTGYILREEVIIQGKNYKNGIVQIKNEGEKVAKNDAICRYKSEGEEELIKKIEELNLEIQEALKNTPAMYPADIALIEGKIQGRVGEICAKNKITDISKLKKDINELILKKAKIAGELSPAGSHVKKLIEKRSSYETELNSNSEYITAPVSGIVSYKIDGYEDFFSSKNIDYLNKELLENLDLKTGQLIESSNEKAKIVNNYECYLAIISDSEEASNVKIGDKVEIEFLNLDKITVKVENIFEEDDGTRVIVFKVNYDVEKLLDSRKISVNVIWWNKNGLKIPNSAIITENDSNYIIRNKAGYKEKVLVKILKQNENYSVIDNFTRDELLDLGYSSSEITKMKKIQVYDEIYIN